jgi:hypothetical protein
MLKAIDYPCIACTYISGLLAIKYAGQIGVDINVCICEYCAKLIYDLVTCLTGYKLIYRT